MTQIARPESDISKGGWNPFPADPTTLFDKINEAIQNGDANYVHSDIDEDECEIKLTAVLDPNIRTGHKIRCYAKSPNGSGAKEQLTISLVENGMVIDSSPATDVDRTAHGLIEYALPEAKANLIQNYANLRLRVRIAKVDGGESIRVTQAEFEVPDVVEFTQFGRPASDITVGSWSPYPADPTTRWDKINEVTPNDDTDYIVSSTDEDECEFALTAVNDPEVGTGHKIRVYARVLNGGGAAEQITISLVENGNVRCEDGPHNVSRGAYTLIEYTLLEAEANSIGNYGNLRLRVHINKTDADEPIRITQAEFECPDAPAGYTITCDPGAYGLTGVATALKHDRKIIAASANYGLSGQSVNVLKDKLILIGAGAYALAGQDVILARVFTLPASAGSYAMTGQLVNLLKENKLSIAEGSYALTGQVVGVYYDRKIIASPGAYGLTGADVNLIYGVGYMLTADPGSYALNGQIANLLKDNKVIISPGSYALGKQDVGLLHASRLLVGSGAYSLTGKDVNLLFVPGIILYSEWLTGWKHRKKITVQDEYVDANLTDFPVYVKIDADADFHEARANGHDIRFTLSDGKTLLKYEREHWTGGNGSPATAHFWVKIPSILAASGAIIYVYYGKSDAPDGQDAPNVWDANFKGVWHLKEIGNGVAGEFKDSSGNANHGTGGAGNPDKTPTQVDGKIYKAQDFDGNDFIDTPYGFDIDPSVSPHTFSMLVKSNTPDVSKLFFSSGHDGTNRMYIAHVALPQKVWIAGIQGTSWNLSSGVTTTTDLIHIAVVMDGSYASIFINGEYKNRRAYTSYKFGANFDIGQHPPGGYQLDGLMDEVRIANIGRSLAWVKFESRNIMEADNEITWGDQESLFPIIFDVVPRRRILDVEARERIYDIPPRKRILELEARARIHNVSPRGRIFDRRST